mgnify:FL=1
MDLLEIMRKQDPLYPAFEQVYATSFPLFEQRTEQQQEQAFQSPNYHLEVYLKDNLFIGFISYWILAPMYISNISPFMRTSEDKDMAAYYWRILINA